jgi:hypothetical protein
MLLAIHSTATALVVIIFNFVASQPLVQISENSVVKNKVKIWPGATIPYEYSINLCKC